jgi:hypothetical protein
MLLAPQSQLMWALLKPMVGLDPKEANLFKQPLIQSRLEPLLGSHYAGAVQLLETADKIQQEGPLFYVVSKYTPVPELAEKAGFVWNSETNQMAVLLVSGGAPQIFAEKLNSEINQKIPAWPAELSDYTDPAKLKQQALEKAKQQISDTVPVPAAIAPVAAKVEQLKNLKEQSAAQIKQTQQDVAAKVLSPIQETTNQLQQQAREAKAQAQQTLSQPAEAAQDQLKQLQQQSSSAIEQPVKQLEQHSKQQLQQTTDEAVKQVKKVEAMSGSTELNNKVESAIPVQSKLLAKPAANNNVTAEKTLEGTTDKLKQNTATALSAVSISPTAPTPAATHNTTDISNQISSNTEADDDLAAELAAEQQSLVNNSGTRIKQLKQDIEATSRQLTLANSPAELLELQQKMQQLQSELKQLTAGQ